ncbi:MAG: hypothetical protein IJ588_08740 [Prevotella sp.]|nr:hypothetical protein [Prevotella sp.]
MTTKQQQLTFEKGITTAPSDPICSDNALQEAHNISFDGTEHRPVQVPVAHLTGLPEGATLIYTHRYNDTVRYIILNGSEIQWGTKNGEAFDLSGTLVNVSGTPTVTSIGKTLIVTDGNGLHYFLWKNDTYTDFSAGFPEPEIEFMLSYSGFPAYDTEKDVECIKISNGAQKSVVIDDNKQEEYNNLVIGLYDKIKNKLHEEKTFCNPFFIRYALELYDGTYTLISNPIPLFAAITRNAYAEYYGDTKRVYMRIANYAIYYKANFDYSDWSDIVKDVVIFISDEVDVNDFVGDQKPNLYQITDTSVATDGVFSTLVNTYYPYYHGNFAINLMDSLATNSAFFIPLKRKSEAQLKEEIAEKSVFYKLCSLGVKKDVNSFVLLNSLIQSNVVNNITTQEQLPEDDYYSRSPIYPSFTYAYNSRLNLANVSRGFFQGFDNFISYANDASNPTEYDYVAIVEIETDSGTVIVRREYQSHNLEGLYFYYPDSRAKWVTLWRQSDNTVILDTALTEHSGLNGAYYFHKLPTGENDQPTATTHKYDIDQQPTTITEILPNYIITSEVNNPFVFKASGYNKVGTGKIIAMSTLTQALSQGQFGQYPLLVFSTEGIWAMSVDNTGLYQSVHPMSREVALEENPCITQTDGAVYFASEKGLMLIAGAQVTCVSRQLAGRSETPFPAFLATAKIAYDYRDSLLWILGADKTYIYNIKSGTFSTISFLGDSIVNFYPDTLVQRGTTVYTLLQRPDANDDKNHYDAQIKTRPLKLENALALKSILQMKHIYSFVENDDEEQPSLSLAIEASNDLRHWVMLNSLRGMPWKYYRFTYIFAGLHATDTFSGTVLITQERRTNKLR